MRNSLPQIKNQFGSKTVGFTVFHGSPHLFDSFEFRQKPNMKSTPGIWFAADESYCRSHGHYIYECKIEQATARWDTEGDILPLSDANALGVDCQIFICTQVNDAIITVNNLDVVEMVRVFDPKTGHHLCIDEIAGLLGGGVMLHGRSKHTSSLGF
jgi:hypothetical protein